MSRDSYVTDELVVPRVDDSDFSVVLSRVLAAIADVNQLRLWFVNHSVRSGLKVDRIEKFERVTSKDPEHPVIAACEKQLVEFRNNQGALRLLESRNTTYPLAGLQIHHFKRAVFQPCNEQTLAFDIHIHMVKAAFNIRDGNLYESKGLLRRLLRASGLGVPYRANDYHRPNRRGSFHGIYSVLGGIYPQCSTLF